MPEQSSKHQLPSLEILFKQSWNLFKINFFKLLILYVITMGIYLLVGMLILIILVIFGLSVSLSNPAQIMQTLLSPPVLSTAGIFSLVILSGLIYLNILIQIATLKVLNEKENDQTSVVQMLKNSNPHVWPVFVVNLLTGLIALGGYMLLILPGLVFALLLSFAPFEIIFDRKSPVEALRRSLALVATDFWGILGRLLLFVLLSLIITALTTSLFARYSGPFFSMLISTLLSWFGIAYSLTIYNELRTAHPNLPGKNIKGLVITSIVGFLIFTLLLSLGINIFLRYQGSITPELNHEMKQYEQLESEDIPQQPEYQFN